VPGRPSARGLVILDEERLRTIGETIGRRIVGPVFFALRGELGAGKSVFARAVARGAGVVGTLPSPTFNLRFDYPLPEGRRLVHMDLYRIQRADDVWELGWEELGEPGEIALVEWPERAERYLPADRWEVVLNPVPDEPNRREVRLVRHGGSAPLPFIPGLAASFPDAGS